MTIRNIADFCPICFDWSIVLIPFSNNVNGTKMEHHKLAFWRMAEYHLVESYGVILQSDIQPDDGVPRLLITESDISYKNNIYKNRMMWKSYQFKIEFITKTYLKLKGK